ncbi:CU044_5270 family protein [Streptomyces sp. NPDC057616]|uniref:CU044_5270 family protein n=1 Tax=Streptomyces sp. NPDC057616 TaxID=3346183 RepID=UPI0036B62B11
MNNSAHRRRPHLLYPGSPDITSGPARGVALLSLPATALAGALVFTLSGGDGTSTPATGAHQPNSASATLNRIAVAAKAIDETPVKHGQYVYVESLTRSDEGTFNGPVYLGALHRRQVWMAQDPAAVTWTGWIRETGKGTPMPRELIPVASSSPVPAGIDRPTYRWLASLPTDPDKLLTLLYSRTRVFEGESEEQAVFSKIGELVGETIMPPANTAAFYRAAAKIPGVREIPDAVDAAGRHGIAGTREDASSATRDEWIFDKDSLAFLGSRSYMTNGAGKEAGSVTLFGTSAIMRRTVVDQHGEAPAKTDG